MSKPALVILHGLFGSKDNWRNIAKALETDRDVYPLDLPNHGQAPHIHSLAFPDMAKALHDTLQEIPQPFDLAGHSLGGKLALQIAHDSPQSVRKLCVLDIAPKAYPPHHQHILDGLSAVPLSEINGRSDAEPYLATHITSPMLRLFLLKSLKKTDEGFTWQFNLPAIVDQYDTIAAPPILSHPINHPTLFLRGALSQYVLDTDSALLQETCPNSSCQTIEKAGHWLHAENPADVIAAIESFLESDT